MSIDTLTFGDSISGLLIDGVEGTPYVGATLRFESPHGVDVDVPFMHGPGSEQFTHVDTWFSERTPPAAMILVVPDGELLLSGLRWRGHSYKSGMSLGKIAVTETLLGTRDVGLDVPLTMTEVRSNIDGLEPWTGFKSVDTEFRTDAQGLVKALTISVESTEGVTWKQGGAIMTFTSDWNTEYPEQNVQSGISVRDAPVLVSRFETPRPFADHLREQRKVVRLLTLMSGTGLYFRRHRAADSHIVTFSVGGTVLARPKADLISRQTVDEFAQPKPAKLRRDDFVAGLADVAGPGLERWSEQSERWKRFILPAVGVLARRGAFAEDQITSLAMSFEAAGTLIGKRDGEHDTLNKAKPTTATYMYRCVNVLGVDWGDIAPHEIAVARAIAKTYNKIKHFDGDDFPDPAVSRAISHVCRYVARLLALHIIDDNLLEPYRKPGGMREVHDYVRRHGVTFSENGTASVATPDD